MNEHIQHPNNLSNILFSYNSFFYPHFLTISSFITLTVNVLACKIIYDKTPRMMERLKPYLLFQQIVGAIQDASIGFFTQPLLFVPLYAGVPLGPYRYFLNPTGYLGFAVTFSYFMLYGVSLSAPLIRQAVTLHKWSMSIVNVNICTFIFLLLIEIVMVSIFKLAYTDQTVARLLFSEKYPWASNMIRIPGIYVDVPENNFYFKVLLVLCAFMIVFFASFSALMVILILHKCSNDAAVLSQKTKNVNRNFAIFLWLQIAIDVVCIVLPCSYIVGSVAFGVIFEYCQDVTNLALYCIANQSCFSTTLKIVFRAPYRRYVLSFFSKASIRIPKNYNTSFMIKT